jgi:hypothetical protein
MKSADAASIARHDGRQSKQLSGISAAKLFFVGTNLGRVFPSAPSAAPPLRVVQGRYRGWIRRRLGFVLKVSGSTDLRVVPVSRARLLWS